MCIWHFDLNELFYYFRRIHTFIHAAGGVVSHPEKGLLSIHRLGKWDLPKGKMEQGENPMITAVREVEEECGVDGLKITGEPYFTYHTYPLRTGKQALKKTWWFPMETGFNGALEAQEEEGITQAVWLQNEDEIHTNTYRTISEVLDYFGSMK
jgi:8-oxo-dGTP pyrophosphatase MutT (NUDIX family)